jgi:hypothetical protein
MGQVAATLRQRGSALDVLTHQGGFTVQKEAGNFGSVRA